MRVRCKYATQDTQKIRGWVWKGCVIEWNGFVLMLPLGPFIYYVSTFFYQLQHFHGFFEHFSSSLCTKNVKLQLKILSKCNVEKEVLLFWRKNLFFVINLEVILSFVL